MFGWSLHPVACNAHVLFHTFLFGIDLLKMFVEYHEIFELYILVSWY